jgi:hypothetical protein
MSPIDRDVVINPGGYPYTLLPLKFRFRSRIRSTQREETDSVRSLSSVSCALTRTSSSISVWISGYEAGMIPWDIEMTVEEPLSDDEDGVPDDVSDTESEDVTRLTS